MFTTIPCRGVVKSISYETQEPLEKLIGDTGIHIEERAALSSLLTQIKGSQITVTIDGTDVSGTRRACGEGGDAPPCYAKTPLYPWKGA